MHELANIGLNANFVFPFVLYLNRNRLFDWSRDMILQMITFTTVDRSRFVSETYSKKNCQMNTIVMVVYEL